MGDKVLVINFENGSIVESKVINEAIDEVIKKLLIDVLPKWSPKDSDLIVMKHEHEVTIKLPLSKELYESLAKFGLSRKSASEVSTRIPVYVVSYDNTWVGDELVDRKFYLVAPYINEDIKKEMESLAKDLTTPESEEYEE